MRVCDRVSVMVILKDCVRDGVGEIVSEWDCERLIDCDNKIESVMDNELDWVKLTDCDRER